MFALFFSLYCAMFVGSWYMFDLNDIKASLMASINKLGEVITSFFNGTTQPVSDLGTTLFDTFYNYPNWVGLVAFILALITSIGIVVMAVKGVKKAFGIFFMGIR